MTTIMPRRGRGGLGLLVQKLLLSTALVAGSAAYVWYDRTRPPPPPAEASAAGQLIPVGPALFKDGVWRGTPVLSSYGTVTVKVTVENGHLVAVQPVKYPKSTPVSARINKDALPRLEREAIIAQSFDVHAITGATFTSKAYAASLKSALDLARLT